MSVQELNKKWWYRLIKVLFGLSLILILIVGNIFVFSGGVKKLDLTKTLVHCNTQYYVNKNPQGYKTFSLKDAGVYYISEDRLASYKDLYTDPAYSDEVEKILSKCSGVEDTTRISLSLYQLVSDVQKDNPSITDIQAVDMYNEKVHAYESQGLSVDNSVKEAFNSLITYNSQQFEIQPHYTYLRFILSFVLTNLVILLSFEIIRRTFYYVVLGKIRPQ